MFKFGRKRPNPVPVKAAPHAERAAAVGHFASTLVIRTLLDREGAVHDPAFVLQATADALAHHTLPVRNVRLRDDGVLSRHPRVHAVRRCLELGLLSMPTPVLAELLVRMNAALASSARDETGSRGSWFFRQASSVAIKARVVYSSVALLGPARCLEAGTAWGMGSAAILHALALDGPGTLDTVEFVASRKRESERFLKDRFGNRVACHHGSFADVVQALGGGFDFVFHDAEHTGAAYVRDFAAMLPKLAPGAVVIFDDIMNNPGSAQAKDCHEGWLAVTRHPRVAASFEAGVHRMGVAVVE